MHRLVATLLLAIALAAAGCALVEPAPSGPLMTIETRGGRCVDGPCGERVAVERDGLVHRLAPNAGEVARLTPDEVAAIDAAIRATDFADLRSRPFTGECPVNFDGQELIYEFSAPSGVERIASCEVEIDPNHPLFATVQALLTGVPV